MPKRTLLRSDECLVLAGLRRPHRLGEVLDGAGVQIRDQFRRRVGTQFRAKVVFRHA
jgi:hypothetical protein